MRARAVVAVSLALLAVFALGPIALGDGPAAAPQARDLGQASLKAAKAGPPIWNDHAQVRAKGNGVEIVPPKPIAPGRFAVARFKGPDQSWVGFDVLVLDVRSEGQGQLDIVLSEKDQGKRESYSIRVDSLPAGRQRLRVRLAAGPEGDLKLSGLTRDGAWNPDEEAGVKLTLADYPSGFAIEGLRLEKSEKQGGQN